MKLNHQTQSLLFFVMRFGVSLYELCILVSALALSIEFYVALSENKPKGKNEEKNRQQATNVGLLDNLR